MTIEEMAKRNRERAEAQRGQPCGEDMGGGRRCDQPQPCGQHTARRLIAPVQSDCGVLPGYVSWEEHCEAWEACVKRLGSQQSAERIAERGGFCYVEMTDLLGHEPKTWRPR